MSNILCFVGHRQSGKDSSALFVYGAWMHALGLINGGFCIKEDGLYITDITVPPFNELDMQGRFDPRRNNKVMKDFCAEFLDPYIKLYSFADDLKQFCINVLGLKWEQCYGSNDDKDSLTHFKWEDMPGIIIPYDIEKEIHDSLMGLTLHNPGFMTAREVMQYFGTDIIRKMYSPAWAKSTLKRINEEQPLLALITDGRFDDEIDEVRTCGGKCIKLLRNPFHDAHKSEAINICDSKFDYIMDNSQMTLDQQNDELVKILTPWEMLPEITFKG